MHLISVPESHDFIYLHGKTLDLQNVMLNIELSHKNRNSMIQFWWKPSIFTHMNICVCIHTYTEKSLDLYTIMCQSFPGVRVMILASLYRDGSYYVPSVVLNTLQQITHPGLTSRLALLLFPIYRWGTGGTEVNNGEARSLDQPGFRIRTLGHYCLLLH